MCLAIPGKIKKIFKDNTAEIEIGGAGFAIEIINRKQAEEIFHAWEGKLD